MAKRITLSDGNVIWQSKFLPELKFTSVMLEVFRTAYPRIKFFEPEMKKAEAWLLANPDRHPTSNWARFVNNWMKNADRSSDTLLLYKERQPSQMQPKREPMTENPLGLSDIIRGLERAHTKGIQQ